jgi:hypothetical protein
MRIVSPAVNAMPRTELAARPETTSEIVARPFVRELLERSPAFQALAAEKRHALASNMVTVAAHLADPADLADQANGLLQAVDFPSFVAGLINGTFQAIVDASMKQMEAYAELLKTVADSVDAFAKNSVSGDQARDHLAQAFPDVLPHTTDGLCHRSLIAALLTLGTAKIMSDA